MLLNKVDLNLFVVFDVIYREGNLTRAGEVLSLTQPAVSNALARLRQSFGDPLFVRSGGGMLPTPVARNLIGPVRQALRLLRTSIEQRERFAPQTSDRLFSLSAGDAAGSVLVPELMAAMRARAPHLRLQCHQIDRQDIATEMAAGRLDFAVDIPQLGGADLQRRELLTDHYVCVLRKGHPLARKPLTMNRFLTLQHIAVSSRRRGPSYVEIALNRVGARADTALRVQYFQAAFHAVQGSDMALAAPRSLARRFDVVVRKLPFDVPPLESHLYWHRNAEHDPANQWMRELISQAGAGLKQGQKGVE